VSDGEPSLKPILRNFRDTEENWPSSSIITILQRPFGVTITHFSDCARLKEGLNILLLY